MSVAHFIGKTVTVMTTPTNWQFGVNENAHYFVGELESWEYGYIVIRELTSGRKSIISEKHLIAIAEEERLDPDNPDDAARIAEVKKSMQKQSPQTPPIQVLPAQPSPTKRAASQYIDPAALAELNKQLLQTRSK
jgi:hypothetical protein